MSHFSFEFPYLFLLIPIFWFCFKYCPAKNTSIYLPYINVLIGKKSIKSRWLDILKWAAVISFVIALASPVIVTNYNRTKQNSRDIMLVIDSSKSMLERGIDSNNPKKSKFDAVKEVVSDFIDKRKADRIGLINFASSAFIASPLTLDKNYLKDILKKQKVGIAGKRTAIYDALLQAIYILNNSKTKSKIAILLTDGIDNMSETSYKDIINFVKKAKIKLYTIGVGGYKDLDVDKLQALAEAGGGKFYMANSKKTLQSIYSEIDKSETSEIFAKSYKKYEYFYYYPLMLAIIFLLIFVYYKSIKGVAKWVLQTRIYFFFF